MNWRRVITTSATAALTAGLLSAYVVVRAHQAEVPDLPPAAQLAPADPSPGTQAPAAIENLTVRVLNRVPHDRGAFTQGLQFQGARLFESTGQYGQSTIREVDPSTGAVLRSTALPRQFFGEGIALLDDRIIMLTWREGTAMVFERDTFRLLRRHRYEGQGWGLAFDGERLIMSDGSHRLQFRDPARFDLLGTVEVTHQGRPVPRLNELCWADGHLYANVFQTMNIVRIDPASGAVTGIVHVPSNLLAPAERQGVDVLNGIAFHPETETFWITGKYWPWMFEVEFVPAG